MKYQYVSSVILLTATFSNFSYSMLVGPQYSVDIRDWWWYLSIVHIQLSLLCLAIMYYKRNSINFLAGWGYFWIIQLNFLFKEFDWFSQGIEYNIAMTTAYAYTGWLIIVLGIDRYQKWKMH